MRMTLAQCAAWANGRLVGRNGLAADRVCTDSRQARPGDLFVAIRGPRHDGHAFVQSAAERGAVAALVQDESALDDLPGVVVEDTVAGLGRLAHAARMALDIPWAAITGSNGKTTTRELLACILRGRGPVVSSVRNFNNRIGVPLSILSAPEDAWAGVIELGTNAPGEIAELARLVRPTVGVVTGVGPAHLEGFGTAENVAKEKAALFSALPEHGLAVYPTDVAYRSVLEERLHCAARRFGLVDGGSDILAQDLVCDERGVRFRAWDVDFRVPVLGVHNVGNVLAAMLVAHWLGVPVREAADALTGFRAVAGRMTYRDIGPYRVVDDTYNANPDSLQAAVQFLRAVPARRRVAIVGAMGELGASTERLHRQCGQSIGRAGIDLVLAVGPSTVALAEAADASHAKCRAHYFPSVLVLLPHLEEYLRPEDLILVKGSRSAGMERVVRHIERLARQDADPAQERTSA